MSSLQGLPVEILLSIFEYIRERDKCTLARTSQQVAVTVAEVVLRSPRRGSWRLLFSVYLRARFATGRHVHGVIRWFPFLSNLSRTCRGCGCTTQRRVNGVLICARCTRDRTLKCWMLPIAVAHNLGVYDIFTHSGPRSKLVFADHVEILTGMSRKRLIAAIGPMRI